jgi:hypothetical protein
MTANNPTIVASKLGQSTSRDGTLTAGVARGIGLSSPEPADTVRDDAIKL